MKILFTGASSFTGYWFVKELYEAGHEVHTIFTQKDINSYKGLRKERVKLVSSCSTPVFDVRFGDKKFLNLLANKSFDVLCHHAAFVKDYKSDHFNLLNAVNQNNNNILEIFHILKDQSTSVILTGSYFEKNEGTFTKNQEMSPYSLSKTITYQIFKKYAEIFKVNLGKFVISNPFGPYEDFRFTSYLFSTWKKNEIVLINTPNYIRDNIHVSLLAKAYSNFVEKLIRNTVLILKTSPSGYVESQKSFAERVAREVNKRTGLICRIKANKDHVMNEPFILSNTEHLDTNSLSWDEEDAWDNLVMFFQKYV